MKLDLFDRIRETAVAQRIMIGETEYATAPVHDPRKPPPSATPIGVSTLAAIVDLWKMDDVAELATCIHVESPYEVQILGPIRDYWHDREVLAVAEHSPSWKYDVVASFSTREDALVALLSRCYDSEHRQALVSILAKVTESATLETTDDGMSQATTIKTGVASAAKVTVPIPALLTPMRTFPEVGQPSSPFVVRLQTGGGMTLHLADGGAWELEAIGLIAGYLRSALPGAVILS